MRQRNGEQGFTATELMIVLTIVGILAAIGLPAYFTFLQNTRAAQAVADLQAVRAAVYLHYGDTGQWPEESAAGFAPPGIVANLPRNLTFYRGYYTLDYDNWVALHQRGGAPPGVRTAIAVSIVCRDRRFLERVRTLLRDARIVKASTTKYMLEIATLDGF